MHTRLDPSTTTQRPEPRALQPNCGRKIQYVFIKKKTDFGNSSSKKYKTLKEIRSINDGENHVVKGPQQTILSTIQTLESQQMILSVNQICAHKRSYIVGRWQSNLP